MFYYLSKAVWFLANPGNLLVLALCLAALLLWAGRRRLAGGLVTGLAVVGLLLAVVPVGGWASALLERRFPEQTPQTLPAAVDGVVVLGGVVDPAASAARGRPVVGGAVERLLVFADLADRYPDAELVFTGGAGDPFEQEHKEAHYVGPLLKRLGVPPGRVRYEDQSRNTAENAAFTTDLVEPRPDETWVLVTSAFHMPRAVGCFRQVGWEVTPYPVDFSVAPGESPGFGFDFTAGLGQAARAGHEWLGLLAYWLLGRIPGPFPGPAAP